MLTRVEHFVAFQDRRVLQEVQELGFALQYLGLYVDKQFGYWEVAEPQLAALEV